MNTDERDLLGGLQELASEGPCQAPEYMEHRLLAEFRQRSRQRRARLWISGASVGAIAAAIAVLLWIGPLRPEPGVPQQEAAVQMDETGGFYPLPDADGLAPVESAMVVRVQLPISSLELIGFPVNQDRDSDPVEAEVLLGQDGLARGVRLVN